MKDEIAIRWMLRQDVDRMLDIERKVYENPWDEDDFLMALQQRKCIGHVAEPRSTGSFNGIVQPQQVVGHVVYEMHRGGIEITRLTVAYDAQGQGVGAALLSKLKGRIRVHGRRSTILMVLHESALDGQLFLASQGFQAVDVLRDYYEDGSDAYCMLWADDSKADAPPFEGTNRVAAYL